LPALAGVLAPGADVVVLVKPQFEVGRGRVGRGGLVTDPALHQACLRAVALESQPLGFAVRAACPSPITGAEGNREFFLHLRLGPPPTPPEAIDAMIEAAVAK
ncbi:MAG TPA: SAM-dependent methyltransferase, partial [Vicinamibacteria bacterium]|nr:SAM-dependent methyltransferase [Vicinamibacteria bacterium]